MPALPPNSRECRREGGRSHPWTQRAQSFPDGRRSFPTVGCSSSLEGLDPTIISSLIVGSIEPDFEPRRIVASDSNGAFAHPGMLLFVQGTTLLQQRFDLDRLAVTGDATPVVGQVYYNPGVGRADFSVSQTGVLAFRAASNRSNQFAWFDAPGKCWRRSALRAITVHLDLSLDGTRLAYADVNQGDIWIFDLSRQTSSRFTSSTSTETAPVWSPDGTKIYYRTDQGGLFEKDASGTGTELQLLKENVNGPSQVSRMASGCCISRRWTGSAGYLRAADQGTGRQRRSCRALFLMWSRSFHQTCAGWLTPSTETERNKVYVQPFPPTRRRRSACLQQRWPSTAVAGRRERSCPLISR